MMSGSFASVKAVLRLLLDEGCSLYCERFGKLLLSGRCLGVYRSRGALSSGPLEDPSR